MCRGRPPSACSTSSAGRNRTTAGTSRRSRRRTCSWTACGASADRQDLELADATRRLELDRLADAPADQRLADGRVDRELALRGRGLRRGHERVGLLLARAAVLDLDAAAEPDDLRLRLHLAHVRVEQLLPDPQDLRLQVRLVVLGVVVLRVLLEV